VELVSLAEQSGRLPFASVSHGIGVVVLLGDLSLLVLTLFASHYPWGWCVRLGEHILVGLIGQLSSCVLALFVLFSD
jgi:hypothetical protein